MPRRRTKSVNDMQRQLSRIMDYPQATSARAERASATYRRYRNNIQRALGYNNNGRGLGVLDASNMRFSNPRYQSIGAINREQVSRRTYMGLANG